MRDSFEWCIQKAKQWGWCAIKDGTETNGYWIQDGYGAAKGYSFEGEEDAWQNAFSDYSRAYVGFFSDAYEEFNDQLTDAAQREAILTALVMRYQDRVDKLRQEIVTLDPPRMISLTAPKVSTFIPQDMD